LKVGPDVRDSDVRDGLFVLINQEYSDCTVLQSSVFCCQLRSFLTLRGTDEVPQAHFISLEKTVQNKAFRVVANKINFSANIVACIVMCVRQTD
jgi:hypothetical protein